MCIGTLHKGVRTKKILFFFLAFELCFPCFSGVETPRTIPIIFLPSIRTLFCCLSWAFECSIQFQTTLTLSFLYLFRSLGVHISRYSLDVTLYNLVRYFQRCIFYFIPSYSCKLSQLSTMILDKRIHTLHYFYGSKSSYLSSFICNEIRHNFKYKHDKNI